MTENVIMGMSINNSLGWRLYFSRHDKLFFHHPQWFPNGKPPPSLLIKEGTILVSLKIHEDHHRDMIEVDCIPDKVYSQMGKSKHNLLSMSGLPQ